MSDIPGSRIRANAHLIDDETVAKMGHPNLLWVRPGPPDHNGATRVRVGFYV
jgi:hypothetical protein